MTPTLFQVGIAILLVIVAATVVMWFLNAESAASARRRMRMMTRLGIDPALASDGDPRTHAIMRRVRKRCRKCMHEDVCERWLAGEIGGDNDFCPNARTFRIFRMTGGRAG